MFQLIYASTAARALGRDDLGTLVERAREKNERLGVTGVLVYRNGSFLHVLEGDDEETVRDLYSTIRADERHRGIRLLKAISTERRDFPGAPLAFRDRSMAGGRRPPLGGAPSGTGDPSDSSAVEQTPAPLGQAHRRSSGSASEAAAS